MEDEIIEEETPRLLDWYGLAYYNDLLQMKLNEMNSTIIATSENTMYLMNTVQCFSLDEPEDWKQGSIFHYIGETTEDFTHGYFYEVIGEEIGGEMVYKWQNVNVQEGGSGGGKKYIINVVGNSGIFNENQISTPENLATLQEIYNNFSDISPADIYFKDSNNGIYNIKNISINNGWINITLICGNASSEGYGVTYNATYIYDLWSECRNDVVVNVSMSKTSSLSLRNGNQVLGKSNTTTYIPTGDYNPATKKYVDDMVSNSIRGALDKSY